MPLIDLPLDSLREYKGLSPCPEDFDAFWSDALAEMRAVDPQVELVPATFQAPGVACFDLYFTGVRGARLHAKYLRPLHVSEPHPAVLQFHGYSGNCGDWRDKLAFTAAGFSVAALDSRGQGGQSQDTGGVSGTTLRGHIIRGLDDAPENLLMRHNFLDTAQLAALVMAMPEVDEDRVAAMGGSQGGGLTVACAALEPRIKCLAPRCPFLSDYRRVWKMDLAKDAYEELRLFFRHFDPTHAKEDLYFRRLGYIDIQNLAGRIRGHVLWALGLMDTVCPPSTQFAAYNKITAPKDMIIYPDFAHENYPGFDDQSFMFMVQHLT
ncbi:MAG: acetylxylan esterase [Ruminococcaceae bacterium]|nr:acetylxylan esterase [Oscillospiraceae bacterium]